MDANTKAVVIECTEGSDGERLSFPEVVGRLMQAGIERYHADLVRSEKIYYMPDGTSEAVTCHAVSTTPVTGFEPSGVAAAVRAIQARTIGYRAFCERIAAAGCVGYWVSLAGRRAVYYGRTGDSYVEPFPGPA